jgi:hypothetical protein
MFNVLEFGGILRLTNPLCLCHDKRPTSKTAGNIP